MEVKEGYKKTEVGVIPEDWEVDIIDNVCSITTGNKNTQDRIDGAKYPFFVRSQTIERIDTFSFDGEAVLTAGDGVGTGKVFHYINDKFDFHQRVYKMSHFKENMNGYFFYLYFSNHFYDRIMQMTAKSSVDSVRREMIANMKILIPTLPEQQTIATVLSDTDNLIQALEKKIVKKELIKKGAMQQLLEPKEGWEEVLMPEVCWFQEGPGVRNTQFTNSGVKLLNGTNIEKGKLLLEKTERYISNEEAYGWYSHFLVDNGDILIACSGVSIEKFHEKVTFAESKHLPLCMNTSTMRFKIKSSNLAKDFLFHFLKSNSFKEQIGGKATGSAQLNFGPSHVSKVFINMPSIEEQSNNAQILSDMDNEIELLQEKLSKYKQVKQGLMQELLTGRIRLV
ncbi:MAG: restriction endonuclease subunit S [Dysgonamonadaceae bacterium]|nr:restriction endonuclease subunit S [Dysgonamonadaceae bacterium]MDD4728425.1 restriction endonuclease subunit S [Dysgonamonadaceae bacterium]